MRKWIEEKVVCDQQSWKAVPHEKTPVPEPFGNDPKIRSFFNTSARCATPAGGRAGVGDGHWLCAVWDSWQPLVARLQAPFLPETLRMAGVLWRL
jgi:hypothetical protein